MYFGDNPEAFELEWVSKTDVPELEQIKFMAISKDEFRIAASVRDIIVFRKALATIFLKAQIPLEKI